MGQQQQVKVSPAYERFVRAQRTHQNEVESFAFFLLAFFAWPRERAVRSSLPAVIYICLFFLCRLGHSLAFANGVQPWRSLFYALGNFVLAAWIIHSLIEAAIPPFLGEHSWSAHY